MAAKKLVYTLKIDYTARSGCLLIQVLKPKRFVRYGFGTFLKKINPKEISISGAALRLLLTIPFRRGPQPMEIFGNKILAWGNHSQNFYIYPENISCEEAAKRWLKLCSIFN